LQDMDALLSAEAEIGVMPDSSASRLGETLDAVFEDIAILADELKGETTPPPF